jgi:hypothetical protein
LYSLHTEALAWLRYAKRLPVVCTEAGSWNADVLGLNGKLCIEVEVKKSRADLRAEFRSKPQKHYVYSHAEEFDRRTAAGFVPNYFYFFVAGDIAEAAKEFVSEKAPYAGVVAVRWPSRYVTKVGRGSLQVMKPAVKLHTRPPSQRLLHAAMMRMGSEICGFRIALDQLKKGGQTLTQQLIEDMVSAARDGSTTLDFEDAVLDLEKRAAELVEAVDGRAWHQLGTLDRLRWMEAARKLLEKTFENADLNNEQVV